jgi:hypothetical protein
MEMAQVNIPLELIGQITGTRTMTEASHVEGGARARHSSKVTCQAGSEVSEGAGVESRTGLSELSQGLRGCKRVRYVASNGELAKGRRGDGVGKCFESWWLDWIGQADA